MKLRISESAIYLRLSPNEFLDLKTKKTLDQNTVLELNKTLKIKLQLDSVNEFNLNNNHFYFSLSNSSYLKIENLIENRREGSCSWIQNSLEIIIDVDLKR